MNINFKKEYAKDEGVDEYEMDRYKVFDVNNDSDSVYVFASTPEIAAMRFFDQVFEGEEIIAVVVEKQLLNDICEFVGVFFLA